MCVRPAAGVGFNMIGVEAFTFDGPWVEASNACFKWAEVGAATDMGASITVGGARTKAQDNVPHWGANKRPRRDGWSADSHAGRGYPLALHGNQVSVTGTNIITNPGRKAAWITGSDVNLTAVTGNRTIV